MLAGFGDLRHSRVCGPLAGEVDAEWVLDPPPSTAYIECAQACGLALLGGPPTARPARRAQQGGASWSTLRCGTGADTIVVGLGGSACTDGGRGLVEALGGLEQARRTAGRIERSPPPTSSIRCSPRRAAGCSAWQKGADLGDRAAARVSR